MHMKNKHGVYEIKGTFGEKRFRRFAKIQFENLCILTNNTV